MKIILYKVLLRLRILLATPYRLKIKNELIRLDKLNYVLISNNCLAGLLYKEAGLQYKTPTVGLYFIGGAYRKFVDGILNGAESSSGYQVLNRNSFSTLENGTLALIEKGLKEIVFLHYDNADKATSAWSRRYQRLNGGRPIFLFSIMDGVTEIDYNTIASRHKETFMLGCDEQNAPAADILLTKLKFRKMLLEALRCVS